MILVAIFVGMIDPFVAAFGIAAGVIWARKSFWAFALVAGFLTLVVSLQIANGHPSAYYLLTQTCALGLWAAIAYYIARTRQRAAAEAKGAQTLKP